jgi:phosphatidylglycerol:prolipoprotein diacylglycerol transferase
MSDISISFPGLGIGEMNPPQFFLLLGRPIYFYGVIIALGFLLAFAYCFKRVREFGLTSDELTDAILIGVPIGIVCARLYYVIFNWERYRANPISMLYIWEGGLAIYGGVIGAVLGIFLFSRVKKINMRPVLDIVSLGLLIGQSVGRWGTFMNREVYGVETESFLKMGLGEGADVKYYHPLFLYESLWNALGFVLLHFLSKRRRFDGEVFLLYVVWYGIGRGVLEGMRMTQYNLMVPGTSIPFSQVLGFASAAVAAGIWAALRFSPKRRGKKLWVRELAEREAES